MKEQDSPIRIPQIMGKWLGGGVEAVVMNYYRHIDREKIQFDFICDSDSTKIPYEEIEKLGGRVILVPPYQKLFKYQKELKRIFKENNYKIIHSHINTLSVFPLFAAFRSKIKVRIAHSHSTTNNKEWKKNILKLVLRPFNKLVSNSYIACSELAGIWMFGRNEYDKKNIYLLNNAIDLNKFKFNEEKRKEKRKELELDDNTLVIGHIGRFVEQKNHMFLIDIFNEVYKKNKKSCLILCGTGPLEENIKEKVKNLELKNVVKFLGQRNDVNEIYNAMDVFILPSLYEGLPVVGVEAQATGIYTLFSDEVTKEVKVLNSTKFISLKESPKKWSEEVLKVSQINRNERIDLKFDVNLEAKKLEKYYMEKLSEN